MASTKRKKPVKPNLDDKKPSVVYGKWLKIWGWDQYGDEYDDSASYVCIDRIAMVVCMDDGGTRIDSTAGESCLYVRETPEEIMKLLADHEFNQALEATLEK